MEGVSLQDLQCKRKMVFLGLRRKFLPIWTLNLFLRAFKIQILHIDVFLLKKVSSTAG